MNGFFIMRIVMPNGTVHAVRMWYSPEIDDVYAVVGTSTAYRASFNGSYAWEPIELPDVIVRVLTEDSAPAVDKATQEDIDRRVSNIKEFIELLGLNPSQRKAICNHLSTRWEE